MIQGPSVIELIAADEASTERIGQQLAAGLAARPGGEGGAVVIAIEGELGAGKTRFVRGLAAGLGADQRQVSSPTFVLAMAHPTNRGQLVHVDAWRIRTVEELASLGWEEALAAPDTVIAIEWASKIHAALPEERLDVSIEHESETSRRILIIDRRSDPAARVTLRAALGLPICTSTGGQCPSCRRPVQPEGPQFPFCSSRCRMADLNRWFRGDYTVSRPVADEDLGAE